MEIIGQDRADQVLGIFDGAKFSKIQSGKKTEITLPVLMLIGAADTGLFIPDSVTNKALLVSKDSRNNIVTSIYGKESKKWLDSQIEEGRLLYLNEGLNQKGSFMTSSRLHLPTLNKIRRSVSLPFGSNEKILTEKDIVKQEAKKPEDGRVEGFTLNGKVYLVDGNTRADEHACPPCHFPFILLSAALILALSPVAIASFKIIAFLLIESNFEGFI